MEEKTKYSKDSIHTVIAASLPWGTFFTLTISSILAIQIPLVVQFLLGICLMGIIIYIGYSSISKIIKGDESKRLYIISLVLVITYFIFVKIIGMQKYFS